MWLWIAGLMIVATIFFEFGKWVTFTKLSRHIPKEILESGKIEKPSWWALLGFTRRKL